VPPAKSVLSLTISNSILMRCEEASDGRGEMTEPSRFRARASENVVLPSSCAFLEAYASNCAFPTRWKGRSTAGHILMTLRFCFIRLVVSGMFLFPTISRQVCTRVMVSCHKMEWIVSGNEGTTEGTGR
jgi:hypothetical protein